ncbi:MAG: hypothetical protein [Bacteriophage sp.]|nr:MAG: hypothetical protein [Bacteriophage sp.]
MSTSYALDYTAKAAANYLETTYTRSQDGDWIIVPDGGAFYTTGLIVQNAFNAKELEPLTQYRALATPAVKGAILVSGKEICCFIIVTDNTVNEITIKRQIVGGDYAVIGSSVEQLISASKIDALSATAWSHVIGAPYQYSPELHTHGIADLYGFETATYQLDKIANAVSMGDENLFGMFFQFINRRFDELKLKYETQITSLTQQVNDTKLEGRWQVNDVILRSDNQNPATVYGYGTWVRVPTSLLIVTDDDTLLGTSKKIGEGSDFLATYYAAWKLVSL